MQKKTVEQAKCKKYYDSSHKIKHFNIGDKILVRFEVPQSSFGIQDLPTNQTQSVKIKRLLELIKTTHPLRIGWG
jgi:hypothetical protein